MLEARRAWNILFCCLCCFDDILVYDRGTHYMVYDIIWREWLRVIRCWCNNIIGNYFNA